MALTETGTLKIRSLTREGLGRGETPLGPLDLAATLPGETVAFERHSYRGKTTGILKEVIIPSAARVTPPCPYFGTCGGCLLQHMNPLTHNRFKLSMLEEILKEQGIDMPLDPLITIPPSQRRRATFEVLKKHDQVFFGFHRFHSNQIINITACLAVKPEISEIIPPLKTLFQDILPHGVTGRVFITQAANGLDITLELEGKEVWAPEDRQRLETFAETHSVARIDAIQSTKRDLLFLRDPPYVFFGETPVSSDARGFLQASAEADAILARLVLEGAAGSPGPFLDLFCGRGTYTLPLSALGPVHGIESDGGALSALKVAATQAGKPITCVQCDLFKSPLTSSELAPYAFCVMNPPRAGAEAQSRALARSTLPRLTYVSCQPETFARDAQILIKGGYALTRLTPVDQFSWSPHLEVVGLFER